MNTPEYTYRLLLRAYPQDFRDEYEHEMLALFKAIRRERTNAAEFWSAIIWDLMRSAPSLRMHSFHARWSTNPLTTGAIMKTMSILAVIAGAATIMNASVEGWVGGVAHHDALSGAVGIVGILAGLSMILAGILLMRRAPGAIPRAQAAAGVCLIAFVGMLVLSPRLSIAANIIGIVFPVVLVVYAQLKRTTKPPTPLMG
jgi:hypothetical protein